MLNDADMAKVRAQRHKMAEIMEGEDISLFVPQSSPALQGLIERVNSGKGLTQKELARMKELAKLRVSQQSATEDSA